MSSARFLTIESVQIDRTAGDGKIYGEIMIEFFGLETVYRRSIGNAETKVAGDSLTLTTAHFRAITDWWLLYLSLYDSDDRHDIAVGDIYYNSVTRSAVSFRRVLRGRHGSVSVRYNVFYGVAAGVEVAVLGGDEARAAVRVFGTVRVRQCLGEGEGFSSVTLFGRSAGEGAPVLPGGLVPLDRSVVAVRSGSYVRVEVELRLAGNGVGGGDELIASGSVDLDEDEGRSHTTVVIEGSGGRPVQVSIRIPSNHN